MTAQIAVANRRGIAMATDSAVTISNQYSAKSFDTANKLFQLSYNGPVGIMIYNNASFLGIPWEILIKSFRDSNRGDDEYEKLEDYCKEFFNFLSSQNTLNSLDITDSIVSIAHFHLDLILENVNHRLQNVSTTEVLNDSTVKKHFIEIMESYSRLLEEEGNFFEPGEINIDKYDENLMELLEQFVGDILEEEMREKLVDVLKKGVLSNLFSNTFTGLVFAGYGKSEILPKCINYEVELMLGGKIKYRLVKEHTIGNSMSTNNPISSIIPFAQFDMAETYINGINPDVKMELERLLNFFLTDNDNLYNIYMELLDNNNVEKPNLSEEQKTMFKVLGKSISMSMKNNLEEFIRDNQVNPFISVVSSLDKNKLAELAENLIRLTSIKREISMDVQTVGGPIDVAIISKDDGFIWLKRKHYFDIDLNRHFLNTY